MTTYIAPGHWLADHAAASYQRARTAGAPAGITDAGRTEAEQARLYQLQGHLGLAARPNSPQAVHQQGIALDLPAGGPREWFVAYGREHGWYRPFPTKEPWHFVYSLITDQHLTQSVTPTPITQEDIVATIEDLVSVLRSEGVSGAGDTGRLVAALDAPLRTIVTEQTTAVVRSEGVSGAGDLGRLVAAIVPAVVAALVEAGRGDFTLDQITEAVETGLRNVLRTGTEG